MRPSRWCARGSLVLIPLLAFAALGSAPPAEAELRRPPAKVRYPDPDVGVDCASDAARGAAGGRGPVQGLPPVPLRGPAEGERDHLRPSRRGRREKHYRPVHYDHGNGIAAADVDGDGPPTSTSSTRRGGNELWKNLGKRPVPEHHRGRRAWAWRTASGSPRPSRTPTTTATRTCSSPPSAAATSSSRTTAAGASGTSPRGRASTLVAHSSGAVFFDYDNDGLLDLFVCNVGRYTSDEKGPEGAFLGLTDAFSGHLHPGRSEYPASTGTWAATVPGGDRQLGLVADGLVRRRQLRRPERRRLARPLPAEHAGRNHYYENAGGRASSRRPRSLPEDALGQPWGSSSSTTTTTAAGPVRSPTCTRT